MWHASCGLFLRTSSGANVRRTNSGVLKPHSTQHMIVKSFDTHVFFIIGLSLYLLAIHGGFMNALPALITTTQPRIYRAGGSFWRTCAQSNNTWRTTHMPKTVPTIFQCDLSNNTRQAGPTESGGISARTASAITRDSISCLSHRPLQTSAVFTRPACYTECLL